MSVTKVQILGKDSIHIGYNIHQHIIDHVLANVRSSTYVIVSDTNIAQFDHIHKLEAAFHAGVSKLPQNKTPRLLKFLIAPGELSKSRETKATVEDWLFEQGCTRDTVIFALGGGIIGDMIGYVAATFMRGVRYIQIPTSLLAMVDSSIGGKTAIDVPHGKNLVGAFWQPELVAIELTFLETLPEREFFNGMAEIIKTAAIWNEEEFSRLESLNRTFLDAVASRDKHTGRVDLSGVRDVVLAIVKGSVDVKAEVVTKDEREGGLRNILNFGHSIGHAFEAMLTPHILHGECVAIGSVLEAELSRYLGHLSDHAVGRLVECFKSYNLPVSVNDETVQRRSGGIYCPVERLLTIMNIDKKNDGAQKRVCLLSAIGKTYEPKATVVSDEDLRFVLSRDVKVGPRHNIPKSFSITPPGSKSISNRVLLLAALGTGTCEIHNLLHSDDTVYMTNALLQLEAADITKKHGGDIIAVTGRGGDLKPPADEIFLGNSGTATRFLASVACFASGSSKASIVTGNARMKQRPIAPLVNALVDAGAQIEYLESQGFPPLSIKALPEGQKFPGGRIELAATVSSQYVSAILMCAPYAAEPVTLALVGGKPISQLYIDMTLSMMAEFGIKVSLSKTEPYTYHIPTGVYKNPSKYVVESDASSATYPLALAAVTGTKCTVPSIGSNSLQGDARFAVDVLKPMGCAVTQTETETTVQGPPLGSLKALSYVDMEPMTDAFLTACAVAAIAQGTTKIHGIANQRVKECNRIEAMRLELAKFGVMATEHSDGIEVEGVDIEALQTPESIHTYDDHRVAMSMSLVALLAKDHVLIEDRACTAKTWPGWWDTLHSVNVPLIGASPAESPAPLVDPQITSSIVVIGMRGAGKSKFSKRMALALHWDFTDMDEFLELKEDRSIPEIITQGGWDTFRVLESETLQKFLKDHPTRHVIACGGGVVETPSARETLKKHMANGGIVLQVHRDLGTIVNYLNIDKTRPAFVDDIASVFHLRRKWYEECSNRYYFSADAKSDIDDRKLQRSIASFAELIVSGKPVELPTSPRTYFLSLTFPDVRAAKNLNEILEGCDAVELRVDLLKTTDPDFVAEQVGYIRLQTRAPIIFTVRTQSQGGKFPNENHHDYAALAHLAFKLNVEYIDLELTQPSSLLARLALSKGTSRILASHHDISGQTKWNSLEWRSKYFQASRYGDVIKFVGTAESLEDNFELEKFRAQYSGPGFKPLIAINMGFHGRLSRALNKFMTPVTHELSPFPAAPGQLSIKEISGILYDIGHIAPKQFFVAGDPVKHSASPSLHNACFQSLGLPHQYSYYQTNDAAALMKHIRELGSKFGGASVTIPLKRSVIEHMDVLTDHARNIGAVNTITALPGNRFEGGNTDWLGIIGGFAKYGLVEGHGGAALIVGAGGTSHAAVYAFHHMGFSTIYILNRTVANAQSVADSFDKRFNVQVLDHFGDIEPPTAVFSCIPGDREIPEHFFQEIVKALGSKENAMDGHHKFMEAAYKPAMTPMMNIALSLGWDVIPGREMLVQQGVAQFKRWTGLSALCSAEAAAL